MKRRAEDKENGIEDREIKARRAEAWRGIIGDIRIMLPILVTLLGGTVYGNSEAVRTFIHGDQQIDAVEDVRAPTDASMDEQQNRAINEIIEKLKKHDADILAAKQHGRGDDAQQNKRLDAIEELVQ